jgi:hypothetical protein
MFTFSVVPMNITLKIEAAWSFETSVNIYPTARGHIPFDGSPNAAFV